MINSFPVRYRSKLRQIFFIYFGQDGERIWHKQESFFQQRYIGWFLQNGLLAAEMKWRYFSLMIYIYTDWNIILGTSPSQFFPA